jgi:hypothetical protein
VRRAGAQDRTPWRLRIPSVVCTLVFGAVGWLVINNATGPPLGMLVGIVVAALIERLIFGWTWRRIWHWRETPGPTLEEDAIKASQRKLPDSAPVASYVRRRRAS